MIVWVISAGLFLVSMGLVALSLLRYKSQTDDASPLTEVVLYREEEERLERALAEGEISKSEAEAERATLGHTLLQRVDQSNNGKPLLYNRTPALIALLALLVILPAAGLSVYWQTGRPDTLFNETEIKTASASPEAEGKPTTEEIQKVEVMLAQAEARLKAFPDEIRGWQVVAPVYSQIGRYEKSAEAYRQLIRLGNKSIPVRLSLAEALYLDAGERFTDEAIALLDSVLAEQPFHLEASLYMILADSQRRAFDVALQRLDALRATLAPDSKVIEPLEAQRKAIVAAASQPLAGMNEENRAMVQQMVARLDERLLTSGGSLEEWQRLIRSFMITGDEEAARDRLQKGLRAFQDDQQKAGVLKNFARELGLDSGE